MMHESILIYFNSSNLFVDALTPYKVCPEDIQPCTMKNRDIYWRRYKKHCTQDNDASVSFKVGTLGRQTVLLVTISCPIVFSWISWTVWNFFPFKGYLSFGKSQKLQSTKKSESPGWFDVSQKDSVWDVMHEWALCRDEAANHQLPLATAFWIIQIVSMEECSSLTQNSMQICCSTHSVVLNAKAKQYTCSVSGIYHPHWLEQWNHHCSHMRIPVHSPWLTLMSGYTDVTQTVLIIVTMAGLFLGRPHIWQSNEALWSEPWIFTRKNVLITLSFF